MLTIDFFIKNIKFQIEKNNFNTLIFNFGQIINDNLFFHNIDNLEHYIEKIKKRDYKFTYSVYKKLTDGINTYIFDNEDTVPNNLDKTTTIIQTKGCQEVLHIKSTTDIKVTFKNIFQYTINEKDVPKTLDQVDEEVIEFIITQQIKLMIINQKYPKIEKVKNDIVIILKIVEDKDQNNSNLVDIYNLINYIFL